MSTTYENRLVHRLAAEGLFDALLGEPLGGLSREEMGRGERERVPAWRTAMNAGDVVVVLPWWAGVFEVKKTGNAEYASPTSGSNVGQWEQMQRFSGMGVSSWYAVYHTRGSRTGRWRFHENDGDLGGERILHREEGRRVDEFVGFVLGLR